MTIIGELAIAGGLVWVGLCILRHARRITAPREAAPLFDPYRPSDYSGKDRL